MPDLKDARATALEAALDAHHLSHARPSGTSKGDMEAAISAFLAEAERQGWKLAPRDIDETLGAKEAAAKELVRVLRGEHGKHNSDTIWQAAWDAAPKWFTEEKDND